MGSSTVRDMIQKITSSRTNLLITVLALLIILFGGYAITGNFAGDPDLPVDGDRQVAAEITTFTDSGKDIELIDGKPVIRLFSTTWCPHCKWITDSYESVVEEYVEDGKIVAYHWEIDINDDTLTPEVEGEVPAGELAVYREFNPSGSIPTFVFGGRYYRVGNGYERQNDLGSEEAEFRAVIEELIANS